MSYCNINIPSFTTLIPVDTRTNNLKVMLLPTVSTNSGQLIIFKDYYGTSSNSTFNISTTGTDLIDDINNRYTFSNAFGSMSFLSDGLRSWRTMCLYDGGLTPSIAATLNPIPGVQYSFLSTNYSGGGTVNNVGSNSAIGAATVVKNAYTSASPGYITNVRASQYVLTASLTFRTLIMICKIRDTASPSYFLDGRPGMANGWIYTGGYGGDWTGTTYYKDAVLTAFPADLPTPLNDSQWHHITLVAPASYTTAMTMANRFSLNEGMGCDIGEIMFFTQTFTLQDVKNNFNFFASRFGWTPVS